MKNKHPLIKSVFDFFQTQAPLSGKSIIAAVSGGLDSVVMLHILMQLGKIMPFELYAAHLDHNLRGNESDNDREFVENLCSSLQIPLHTQQINVNAYCKTNNCSIETGARECRYRFFEQIRNKLDANYLATAHHADDNAETILDRLLRGSGVKGLTGIPAKRDFYVRPLLSTSRKEIESYAEEHHLNYRTDSTNADTRYKRNRIRHTLMPLLQQEFNPGVIQSLNRFSTIMQETHELVEKESQIAFSQCLRDASKDKIILDIIDFLAYLVVLRKEMIKIALEKLGEPAGILDFDQQENLMLFIQNKKSGTSYKISKKTRLLISGSHIVIWQKAKKQKKIELSAVPGENPFWSRYILEINKAVKPLEFQNKASTEEWIDADKLLEPLFIRTVKSGDRFNPVNFHGSKKISDYFIDLKIPIHERDQVPLLISRDQIVWIIGHRLAEQFKVTENTQNIYQLKLRSKT